MSDNFFESIQGAGVLKHALLQRYPRVFASKLGSASQAATIAYLDGYAGPGRYADGSRGSPQVVVDAVKPLAGQRNIRGIFVEKDPDHFAALEALVQQPEFEQCIALQGTLSEHLDTCLRKAETFPLLAFVDPFGLAIPFDQLCRILARPGRSGTELLLNVSLSAIRREAGHLTSDNTEPTYLKARETVLANMDATMGGAWWRPIWSTRASDAGEQIAHEYMRRLSVPNWRMGVVSMSDRWKGPPAYYLLFLTRSPHGVWHFGEALSNATEKFFVWYFGAMMQPMIDAMLRNNADQWIATFEENVRRLLPAAPFEIIERYDEVFANGTWGYAREKHLRQALKRLEASGEIKAPVRGDLMKFVVRRP